MGVAVFPGPKPKQNEPQPMAPGGLHQHIGLGEIIMSLFRFQKFPVNRRRHCVESNVFHMGKDGLYFFSTVGSRVIYLTTD